MACIKCDNPECDYRDDSVKYEDYPNWLNKPCPKCGQNLLTKEDYKVCRFLVKLSNLYNKLPFSGKEKKAKIKFKKAKIKIFVSFIALKRDKISTFKTICAKVAT